MGNMFVQLSWIWKKHLTNLIITSVLLTQLSSLGLSNLVLRWFQDYLFNRTHHVKSNKTFSSWAQMKAGIPQGSALGPHTFLKYATFYCKRWSTITICRWSSYYYNMQMIPLLYAVGQLQKLLRMWWISSYLSYMIGWSNIKCHWIFRSLAYYGFVLVDRGCSSHILVLISINDVNLQTTQNQKYLCLICDRILENHPYGRKWHSKYFTLKSSPQFQICFHLWVQ